MLYNILNKINVNYNYFINVNILLKKLLKKNFHLFYIENDNII